MRHNKLVNITATHLVRNRVLMAQLHSETAAGRLDIKNSITAPVSFSREYIEKELVDPFLRSGEGFKWLTQSRVGRDVIAEALEAGYIDQKAYDKVKERHQAAVRKIENTVAKFIKR